MAPKKLGSFSVFGRLSMDDRRKRIKIKYAFLNE